MAEAQKIIRPQAGFQEKFVRTNADFVIGGGVLNCGKCMPLYSHILTPNGWVKNSDIKEGDEVCTPFNGTSTVLGVFPQGKKEIYVVETSDGRKSECGEEHLWMVRDKYTLERYRSGKDGNNIVATTREILDRMREGKEFFLPINDKIDFPKKEYPIHPYVLGVLIGDGCLTDTNGAYIAVSNTEEDIIEKVRLLMGCEKIKRTRHNHTKYFYLQSYREYRKYLRDVGLMTYSYNKSIPKEYLFGSIEQRIELLKGLMDTDGCVKENNKYYFSTTSRQLKDDFLHLCRSLGYIVSASEDSRHDKYTQGQHWTIYIRTTDVIVSSLKHLSKIKSGESLSNKRHYDHVKITSITRRGNTEMQCISIADKDHLYIVDDFVVTHNTFAAVLSVAEPSLDGRFRGLFLRNNLGDAKAAGGILDTFKEVYGNEVEVVESGEPRVTFRSGAKIDVTHVADQSRDKVLQRFKGRQYDFIYFDEGTGFTWECFTAIYSRNRGTASWTGRVRMTTNPERNHWLRKFLDWYIGADGFIREDREGVVRYFYINGETVDDVVWGDTKEECYQKCKIQIDRVLAKVNGKTGKATYQDIIKSFTFYLGRMSENKASIGNNSGYVGSVALTGGRNAQQLLEGNWNVSVDEDLGAPITSSVANQVFMTDPQSNGDKWVTCDLADTGTDNFLALAWDGFHITDALILGRTTPRQNAERLEMFAASHGISNSHIIYDAVRGTYINDYIPEAIPFVSYRAPMGMYGRMAYNLKAECYLRLIEVLKRENLSMADEVSQRVYEHQNLKSAITIQNEFMEECSVVRFKDMQSGKKALISKKEMNAKLGKARSMDLLDPIAMRMLPCLEYVYGEELEKTTPQTVADDDDDYGRRRKGVVNIYDDDTWA